MAFRGASADSFAALSDELEGALSGPAGGVVTRVLSAVLPDKLADKLADKVTEHAEQAEDEDEAAARTAHAERVGADLFSVASVLRSEPGLRRVATDVATEADAKAGLLRGILAGKVDDTSLDLVASAARRRWRVGSDLVVALENLGVIAVVRSAGRRSGSRLSDELFGVGQLINSNPELRNALSEPTRSVADKQALLRGLLQGRTLPATARLAEQALSGSHRTVGVAIAEYQRIAADAHQENVARVKVARDLSEADRSRLQQALTRQYGREVHINVVVDPTLLGGMKVEIGDDVIDGTVVGRLDDARRRLVG